VVEDGVELTRGREVVFVEDEEVGVLSLELGCWGGVWREKIGEKMSDLNLGVVKGKIWLWEKRRTDLRIRQS
jgi:hypothetical protein